MFDTLLTSLDPTILTAAIGVFIVMVFASFFVAQLRKKNPEKDYSSLHARIQSWWLMVTVFFGAMLIGGTTAIVLFAYISFLALKEFLTLIPALQADRRVMFWAYMAIPIQFTLIGIDWYGAFVVFVPVYVFLLLPTRRVLAGVTDGFIQSVSSIQWGTMLTVFALGHIAAFTMLEPKGGATPASMILFVVICTQLNDVFQYIWGKSFGHRRVTPNISPNKTWAGLLGGIATTTLIGFFLGSWLTPLNSGMAAALGGIISVVGFFGDLNMSAVKRDLGIKDTGNMLPGHGGILDRVDSLIFTAAVSFHFIKLACY